MTDEDRESLEIKIAYLEKASSELSEVLFRQQRKIEQLEAQIGSLHARLVAIVLADAPSLEDEKPPHY